MYASPSTLPGRASPASSTGAPARGCCCLNVRYAAVAALPWRPAIAHSALSPASTTALLCDKTAGCPTLLDGAVAAFPRRTTLCSHYAGSAPTLAACLPSTILPLLSLLRTRAGQRTRAALVYERAWQTASRALDGRGASCDRSATVAAAFTAPLFNTALTGRAQRCV